MISVLVQRIGRGLYPLDGVAETDVFTLPARVELRADIVEPTGRSLRQLRLYWMILQMIAEGMSRGLDRRALHKFVKLRCGVIDDVVLTSGEIVEVPGSIALDRMDQVEFNRFFDKAMVAICAHLTSTGREDLLREAEALLDRGELS